jgi:curli biogenesis system outer membrane secretion channel CsgG
MRKWLLIAVAAAMAVVNGCASPKQPAGKQGGPRSSQLLSYTGPKARIAVADFEMSSVKAAGAVNGLRRMLTAALINSGRFIIVDNQQKSPDKNPDLTISVLVAAFEPQASGGTAGIGGGGGVGSGLMGGLLGPILNKAHLALDIRITDTATSLLLASTRVQGEATDAAVGFMAGYFGGWEMDTELVAYANTPMEKAIRICIIEAIRYISQSTPATYFRYPSQDTK